MKFKEISQKLYLGAKVKREKWHEGVFLFYDIPTNTMMLNYPDRVNPLPFRDLLGEIAMTDHILANDWEIVEEAPFKSTSEMLKHMEG